MIIRIAYIPKWMELIKQYTAIIKKTKQDKDLQKWKVEAWGDVAGR